MVLLALSALFRPGADEVAARNRRERRNVPGFRTYGSVRSTGGAQEELAANMLRSDALKTIKAGMCPGRTKTGS